MLQPPSLSETGDRSLEIDKSLLENSLALALEYHRETTAFALASIRNALLVNGGGAVGLLAFAQNLVANGKTVSETSLMVALSLFALGMCAGVYANLLGYFAQLNGTSRAIFDAIRSGVVFRGGFGGELARFAPRDGGPVTPDQAIQYVDSKRRHFNHQAERHRVTIILLIVGSYAMFVGGTLASALAILDAV